jgi:SAM-dependent methyltransferase
MDESMKIYWKLYSEFFSNEAVLRNLSNPLREYENEFIDGAMIDIGCGQSSLLLDFSATGREMIAVDNEQMQLDYLKQRVINQATAKIDKWRFCLIDFPNEELLEATYSLMIFSNILHFFSLEECILIGRQVEKKASPGTFVYVSVHSVKFYANNPDNPTNNEYFKHYFSIEDLEKVLTLDKFERIYYAEVDKIDSKIDQKLTSLWLDTLLEKDGVKNPKMVAKIKKDYLKNKYQSDIVAIFRKK